VYELYYYNGTWWGNDLTAATNGPTENGGLSSFFDGNIEHVFYTSATDNHLHELYYNGRWWGNDLTVAANAPFPNIVASLTSFFDGSVEHVFYISDGDYHVHELFNNGTWHDNDLTADTNGPIADISPSGNGQLTSFFDGSVKHVFYISFPDFHVRELYYNGAWWGNDLTADTNGPAADSRSELTSFFDGGAEHVFYIGSADLHVRELYYNGRWWRNDLTADTKSPHDYYPFPYLTSFVRP